MLISQAIKPLLTYKHMMYAIGDHVQYKNIHGAIRFICDESLSILVNDPEHKALECRVVVHQSEWHLVQNYSEN